MATVYIGWRGVIQLLRDAGFSEARTITLGGTSMTPLEAAFCVIQGESAGDPWSTNYNGDDKPAKGWFPGGESHDCGLVQWNDYWWGADADSPIGHPRDEWYAHVYNPRTAARYLYDFTDGGVRNWSTWLAFNNGSFLDHLNNARTAIAAGPPAPFRPLIIGGRTWLRASSIAARCNPGISVDRWFRFNAVVIGPKGELIDLSTNRDRLLQPGTRIRVPFWTTRIQAGPLMPEFTRA